MKVADGGRPAEVWGRLVECAWLLSVDGDRGRVDEPRRAFTPRGPYHVPRPFHVCSQLPCPMSRPETDVTGHMEHGVQSLRHGPFQRHSLLDLPRHKCHGEPFEIVQIGRGPVHCRHRPSLLREQADQVQAEEAGRAGDEYCFCHGVLLVRCTGIYIALPPLEDAPEWQGEQKGGDDHQKSVTEGQGRRSRTDHPFSTAHRSRRGVRGRTTLRHERHLCLIAPIMQSGVGRVDVVCHINSQKTSSIPIWEVRCDRPQESVTKLTAPVASRPTSGSLPDPPACRRRCQVDEEYPGSGQGQE